MEILPRQLCTVLDMTLTVSTSRMDLSGTWLQYRVNRDSHSTNLASANLTSTTAHYLLLSTSYPPSLSHSALAGVCTS